MHRSYWQHLPIAADLIGLLLYLLFFSSLVELMGRRNIYSAWLLILLYLAFCFGVNGIKKLVPAAEAKQSVLATFDISRYRSLSIGVALVMIAFFLAAEADLNRFGESIALLAAEPGQVNEAEVTLYFAYGPSFVWVVVALFYLLVHLSKKAPHIRRGSRGYDVAEFLGLLSINVLLVVVVAYLTTIVGRIGSLSFGASTAVTLGLTFLLLLLFLPPRLIHYFKESHTLPLITFLILLLVVTFSIVSP